MPDVISLQHSPEEKKIGSWYQFLPAGSAVHLDEGKERSVEHLLCSWLRAWHIVRPPNSC